MEKLEKINLEKVIGGALSKFCMNLFISIIAILRGPRIGGNL